MRTPEVALLAFPGLNCEAETASALEVAGARVRRVEWSQPLREPEFDAFVIPGGFSYEDRVRAGAVASRSPWMDALHSADQAGKPILGICNGAQVLVESGLVPGWLAGERARIRRAGEAGEGEPEIVPRVRAALAANQAVGAGGYQCQWVFVEVGAAVKGWLRPLRGKRWPVPVAHGEGRFTSEDPAVVARLQSGELGVVRYVQPDGSGAASSSWDPNGSLGCTAAMGNARGNVIAFMPHPERASWLRQVPEATPGEWGDRRRTVRRTRALERPGPGLAVFRALVRSAARGKA